MPDLSATRQHAKQSAVIIAFTFVEAVLRQLKGMELENYPFRLAFPPG
ncbi:MAG TPA: hypothetical protein VK196_21015 [Magnetospirillum sp.]|nr:hypothetical protein [Magnetospirillum sp.]